MAVEVVLPALGLTVEKGKILKWIKKEGDRVLKGEPLYEVEADKVTTEVESPASGILRKILIPEGMEVPILTPVAVVTDEKESLPDKYSSLKHEDLLKVEARRALLSDGPAEPRAVPAARALAREKGVDLKDVIPSGPDGTILLKDVQCFLEKSQKVEARVLATPAARKLAEKEGVSLAGISGSGISGRIMSADVIAAREAETRTKAKARYGLGQTIAMSSMRKVIAKRMALSSSTAPHIYFFNDVDMDRLIALREEIVSDFERDEGVRISINDFIIKAVALTLRECPILNATVSGDEIRIFPSINIGLAVALEEGLIVPAIPEADRLGLAEIARRRADLVERARQGRLRIEEIERGTFTISSLAHYDIVFFTAILNPPQSGILTLGKVQELPVVRNRQVVIRKVMRMGLSVDHRIVDGAVAAGFLQSVKRKIENPHYSFVCR